jgi:GTP cyclohydrolase I
VSIDKARVEKAVAEILEAIGADLNDENFDRTPQRVAEMFEEVFGGLAQRPEDVLSVTFDACHDEMILVRDIDMVSVCAHHLVPFIGKAHVAYIPNEDGDRKSVV